MDTAARAIVQQFVGNGGGMIVAGTNIGLYNGAFLDGIFGFSIGNEVLMGYAGTTAYPLDPAAAGTQFAGGPATLPLNDATSALPIASLPAGSKVIYDGSAGTATVALLPFGAGKIVYMGWDWFDAIPIGTLDGGWVPVLNEAMQEVTPAA
jgi:hypothetical protein